MSLKSAVDAILPKSSLGKAILYRAYRSLLLRTNRSDSPSYDPSNILASGNLKQRRHSTSVRPGNLTSEDNLIESIFANGDFMGLEAERNVRRTTTTGIHDVGRLRRAVYPAVLLNEFVQELAAICHERAMASMVDACVDWCALIAKFYCSFSSSACNGCRFTQASCCLSCLFLRLQWGFWIHFYVHFIHSLLWTRIIFF